MRILISCINFAPELTGIGRYTAELTEWLLGRGHEVAVVTAPPYYPYWKVADGYSTWSYQHEDHNGASVTRCPLYVPASASAARRVIHYLSFGLSSLPALVGVARRFRPDVMFTIEPPLANATSALIASRIAGAKSWLHIQDLEIEAAFALSFLRSKYLRSLLTATEKRLMRSFDKVSTISPPMEAMIKRKGVDSQQCSVVPNWVDTGQIFPHEPDLEYRRSLGIDEHLKVVLYSGSIGKKQGLELVLQAARKLEDRPEIVFVICGQGPGLTELRELSREQDNIRWLPLQPADRLNDLLNIADVHLLPQRAGVSDFAMPSKLLGIMASGKPVIGTVEPDSGLGGVVQHGGIAVKPGHADFLTEAISTLLEDPARCRQLGENGRRYVGEHFEKEVVLSNLESALTQLIT